MAIHVAAWQAIAAIGPKIIDAVRDKKSYSISNLTESNTLITTYPALGLAVASLMSLPPEPTVRDWVVTAGLVIIGIGAFYVRSHNASQD